VSGKHHRATMFGESVHSGAIMGSLPQLNLFEGPVVQSGVQRSMFVEFRPTSQISSQEAPVSFTLGGDSTNYLDLKRTRLYVKVKIVNEDGSDTEATDLVCPINNILHSLWSEVEIKISGKTVSLSNNCYPYKAYLQTLLSSSYGAKVSHLAAQGFRQDDGNVDSVSNNEGATWRFSRFAGSTSMELEGPLNEDICQTNRYILSNTQVDLKLFRSKQPFVIMTETDKSFKIVLEDVTLKACYVDVHPGIITGHAAALAKGNALYPFTRVEMLSFNLSAGSRQFNLDNLFNGQCPTKALVVLVESERFSGTFKTNPFKFDHFDLSEIELTADGVSVPSRALKVPEFEDTGRQVVAPYTRLFDSIGASNPGLFGNGLDPEDFSKGYAVFSFPVYGGGPDSHFMQMKRSANIRVQGSFSKALPKAVTAVIYAEFPAVMEIEASRNVIIN